MGSRLYDLFDAIEDLLSGVSWSGAEPDVVVGEPVQMRRETVVLSCFDEEAGQSFAYIGQGTRTEQVRIKITVYSFQPASNVVARSRLREMTDAIEVALKRPTPLNLGVSGVNWLGVGGVHLTFEQTTEGWLGLAVIPVAADCLI